MKFFRRKPPASGPDLTAVEAPDATAESEHPVIEGDRGIASVNQGLALQFRLSNLLAIGLMLVLGLGFLSWYYAHALNRQDQAREVAQGAVRSKAQGEMPLPSIGAVSDAPEVDQTRLARAAEQLLGPAPALPGRAGHTQMGSVPERSAPGASGGEGRKDRRLTGPVFVSPAALGTAPATARTDVDALQASIGSDAEPSVGEVEPRGIGAMLKPSVSPAVRARVLPTQQMLLPKGAFIDCTLETAIDSSLPGLTTCITATDTFGADGKVVLLERGTKLVGETRGEVQQGTARVFVLWTEARTPTGVVVPLAAPGTDELGRSGLPGKVNTHFLQRFGAAILISIIDGAVQAAVQSGSRNGGVIYNANGTQEVMTGVLKSTIAIPPTVVKNNGDRIQVLVARDLDFRSVYELRTTKRE